jgi:glycosyltransferase involved in cell wall biosynthesis
MDRLGMPLTFVLPKVAPLRFAGAPGPARARSASFSTPPDFVNVRFKTVVSALSPYARGQTPVAVSKSGTSATHAERQNEVERESDEEVPGGNTPYGADLQTEVRRYASRVLETVKTIPFDLIHAHDWMTFPAGAALAARTARPLIVHVHSTEFDRSGQYVNHEIYNIERNGMHAASKVITVSNYTRNMVISRYDVLPARVEVVYNGVDFARNGTSLRPKQQSDRPDKTVLFLGRITMQKGPEYFLRAAQKLLERMDNVRFVMAGDGDMLYRSIELAAELGIGHKVFFTRFLRGEAVDRAYQMADLYVMPSVSEPFGIAPLEALQHDVPVLISKQSGIAERLHHALKVDFWDIDEMSNKMAAVLQHRPLQEIMRTYGRAETLKFRWIDAAARINEIYRDVLSTT